MRLSCRQPRRRAGAGAGHGLSGRARHAKCAAERSQLGLRGGHGGHVAAHLPLRLQVPV